MGFFFFFFFPVWSGLGFWWLIWVDQRWRKRWSSGGDVWVLIGVDLGFFFFFFFLLWLGLIGDVWVFGPVGFWWLIWVDRRWRKHWSSGGGVWVLIWVFFVFPVVIGVDRRCVGFCFLVVVLGFSFSAVFGFWSGLNWVGFRRCMGFDRGWTGFFFFFFFLLWLGLIGVWVHEFVCVHQWLRACWNRFGFSNCVMCMMRGRSILVVVWWWWCGDWWWWSRGGGGVVIDDGGAIEVWCGGGVVMVEPLESCQVWKVWKKLTVE